MRKQFASGALNIWNKIPESARKKLLSNVWCGKCQSVTTIVGFHGSIKGVDLVLAGVCENCGANVVRVVQSSKTPEYTHKQGQYLAFIYYYTKLHGRPPSEIDMQRYFRTTPPTVHQMVVRLEEKGFISKIPRKPRSIRLLLSRDQLPDLE